MGTRFDRPSLSLTAKLSIRQVEAAFKLLDKREKKVKDKWSARNRRLDDDRDQHRGNTNSGLPIAPPVTPSSSLQKVLNEGLAGGWQDYCEQQESSGGITETGQATPEMSMVHYFGYNATVGQKRRPSSARYPSQEQKHNFSTSNPIRRPQSARPISQFGSTEDTKKRPIPTPNLHRRPMTAPSPTIGSGQGCFSQDFSVYADSATHQGVSNGLIQRHTRKPSIATAKGQRTITRSNKKVWNHRPLSSRARPSTSPPTKSIKPQQLHRSNNSEISEVFQSPPMISVLENRSASSAENTVPNLEPVFPNGFTASSDSTSKSEKAPPLLGRGQRALQSARAAIWEDIARISGIPFNIQDG